VDARRARQRRYVAAGTQLWKETRRARVAGTCGATSHPLHARVDQVQNTIILHTSWRCGTTDSKHSSIVTRMDTRLGQMECVWVCLVPRASLDAGHVQAVGRAFGS